MTTPAKKKAHTLRTLVGTGSGNALEWYDWQIYVVFAPFFASQFFDPNDPAAAMLSSMAIFAAGFLMRPLGGLLFGWLADRAGRRTAMTSSIACAAIGSLVIACAPTYASIGVGASLVVLLARLAQGLAHGGELPAAQTYITEMAPNGRRGRWSSLIYVSGTSGVLVGTLLSAILSSTLPMEQLHAWGWRIPFVIGGVLSLYSLYLRRQLSETENFEQDANAQQDSAQGAKAPKRRIRESFRGMWENRGACLRVIGLTVGVTVVYYTWTVSAPSFAITSRGVAPDSAMWAGVVADLVFIGMLPLYGMLADRIGRRPLIIFAAIGLSIVTIPLNHIIQGQAWQLCLAMVLAMVFIAPITAISPTLFAEMFPTRVRAAAVGLPYAIAVALCGGTAPYLRQWLAGNGGEDLFLGYTIVLMLIGLVVAWRMPETKDVDLNQLSGKDSSSGSESHSAANA